MLRFMLLQNRQGKTRIARWYVPYSASERGKIESEIHRAIVSRDKKWSNFVEYHNYKLIYRQYAGLFFTLCVDVNENELETFELIHLIVEVLDLYFGNVCELDLVFQFDKVYQLIDELILNGEVGEVSPQVIVDRMRRIDNET
eukprot:Trichotokara_eunicae@DN1381_c0_g1_i2.p1